MSNSDQPPPYRPREPRQRSGCVTAFLLAVGIILLIPGALCAIINAHGGVGSGGDPLTMMVTLVALGGLGLIVFAVTR